MFCTRHARMASSARAAAKALGLESSPTRPPTADGDQSAGGHGRTSAPVLMEKKYGIKMANGQDAIKGRCGGWPTWAITTSST